ncbi:aldo/keto reductase [Streptomyces sp. NPDC090080]|uniref:aldo/keto reductase n=1 Tax=Streptomyces sp. NPDC090080 TaxID=3365939 RepID=UPI0038198544
MLVPPDDVEALERVAAELGATPRQTALAWLLHRSPTILLIPGTSTRAHLAQNIAAATIELPPQALRTLDAIAGAPA